MHKIIKNHISCFLCAVLIFSIICFTSSTALYAADSGGTVTISGTFYLPNGVKASHDMNINIYARSANEFLSTSITIPNGANSQKYSIDVPKDSISSAWTIEYVMYEDESGYSELGFYGGNKSVSGPSKAVVMDIDTDADLASVKNAGSAPANDFKIKVTLASALTASAVTTPTGWSVSGSGTVWTFQRDLEHILSVTLVSLFKTRFHVTSKTLTILRKLKTITPVCSFKTTGG